MWFTFYNTDVQDELLNGQLTDRKLLELSEHFTDTEMLRSLTITGLNMGDHVIDSRINNHQKINEAAHECLKEWRLNEQHSHVTCSKLIKALDIVGLSSLVHILK